MIQLELSAGLTTLKLVFDTGQFCEFDVEERKNIRKRAIRLESFDF